jgi:hypothetical protein
LSHLLLLRAVKARQASSRSSSAYAAHVRPEHDPYIELARASSQLRRVVVEGLTTTHRMEALMLKKTVIATGVGAAVLLGGGGAALAATSSSTAPQPASTSTGKTAHKHKHHDKIFRGEYAQWRTYDAKTKTSVTHDGVRGAVKAVSATSISVTTKDGTMKTYLLNSGTKVHAKGDTKAKPGSISQIKVGDRAEVIGTGTTTMTATHVIDRGLAKSK